MTIRSTTSPGQWPEVARNWDHIASPLRPSAEDVQSYCQVLSLWSQGRSAQTLSASARAPHALILGVTPELYALPWPDHTVLRGADRTQAMIDHVWPGKPEDAICGDWLELDLGNASLDIIVCDGGLIMPDYPHGQQALCNNVSRMLAPGGIVAFRLYVPPAHPEAVEDVLTALQAGAIPDLNCLKLRLGMAMQPSPEQGVALADIWETLRGQTDTGWSDLADRLDWSHAHLQVVDAYRGSQARYYFASAEQAIVLFENAGLRHILSIPHHYAMGEQCPLVVFQKAG